MRLLNFDLLVAFVLRSPLLLVFGLLVWLFCCHRDRPTFAGKRGLIALIRCHPASRFRICTGHLLRHLANLYLRDVLGFLLCICWSHRERRLSLNSSKGTYLLTWLISTSANF